MAYRRLVSGTPLDTQRARPASVSKHRVRLGGSPRDDVVLEVVGLADELLVAGHIYKQAHRCRHDADGRPFYEHGSTAAP